MQISQNPIPLRNYVKQALLISLSTGALLISICLFLPGVLTHEFIERIVSNRATEWYDELSETRIITAERMLQRRIPQEYQDALSGFTRASGQYRMVIYDAKGDPFWTTSSLDRVAPLSPQIVAERDEQHGAYTVLSEAPSSQIEHFVGYGGPTEQRESSEEPVHTATVIFTFTFVEHGQTLGYVAGNYEIDEEYTIFLRDVRITVLIASAAVFLFLNFSLYLGMASMRRHEATLRRESEYQARIDAERQKQNADILQLSEFSQWLHSCNTLEELFNMMQHFTQTLLGDHSGTLHVLNMANGQYEQAFEWNGGVNARAFEGQDCWAIRRGRMFRHEETAVGFPCKHLPETAPAHYICMPLLANGETIGLLHVQAKSEAEGNWPLSDRNMRLLQMISEQMSMSLANARLRDRLIEQSTIDPLTKLYNRRHLSTVMTSALARATKHTAHPALIAFDVDHFKRFNDTYGHDAGDKVLEHIAKIARNVIGDLGYVARPGGEEFAVFFDDIKPKALEERAEALRLAIGASAVAHAGQVLPRVTVSIGTSHYPQDGQTPEDLITLADMALYAAKEAGRNCVRHAGDLQTKIAAE